MAELLPAAKCSRVVLPPVVAVLASVLQRIAQHNDGALTTASSFFTWQFPSPPSIYQASKKPGISVAAYLERIFRYVDCSPSCYVVAYIYLDRFSRRRPTVPIESLNVHRLIITAVLLAVKFLEDRCHCNEHFAIVGGVSVMEMNKLEVDMLFSLEFKMNVTPEVFADYCSILRSELDMLCLPLPPPSRFSYFSSDEDNCSGSGHQKLLAYTWS